MISLQNVHKRSFKFHKFDKCWSIFLITLQPEGLQIYQKGTPTQVFSCEIYTIFKSTPFFTEHLRWLLMNFDAFIFLVKAYKEITQKSFQNCLVPWKNYSVIQLRIISKSSLIISSNSAKVISKKG